ncbi:MAG: FAD binding domain-containing protein, partial [Kiritimatiellae bacterium]|nr:FAD binding domain-containing protein [Kiritimatiellia bacterium]
ELRGVRLEGETLCIGAAETVSDLLQHPLIQTHAPLLCEAIRRIGSRQIRNRATLAGNLVNAAPCADAAPPLLAYNAVLRLQSASTERLIPLSEFIVKHYQTLIRPDEMLTEIRLPLLNHTTYRYAFQKLGRRNALNITRISACLLTRLQNGRIEDCRFACGALFHAPCRLPEIETLANGKPLTPETLEKMTTSLDSLIENAIGRRWSSEYKKPVFLHMARDIFRAIQP